MSGLVGVASSVGALGLGIWLWRASRVATVFKLAAILLVVLGGLSIAGVIEVSINIDAVVDMARSVWDLRRLI